MSIVITAARHRFRSSVAGFLVPLLCLGTLPALAQQSASPDLPRVVVESPAAKRSDTSVKQDSAKQDSGARRAARIRTPRLDAADSPSGAAAANPAPTAVVSPTGTVTPGNETASSVTVITAQDIETLQRRTVPDALSTVPGLNVVQTGGPGGITSVFLRGTNANQTKVLIDGIDVSNPANAQGNFDLGQLLTADIAQIEVLRGPQSGLYGSDAIGGVISIITKKGEGPPRATASIEAGSFGTFNQNVGLSGSQDRFNYAFTVAHFHAGDVPVTPLQLLPPGRQAIGNNYDNLTYSTKLGAEINEFWSVNAVARYTDATLHFTGDSGFPFVPDAAQSTTIVHQLFTREEAVWSWFDGRIRNYFGVNYVNHWTDNITAGNPVASITTGERVKYDWRAVTELARGNNLILGLERETDQLQTTGLSAQNANKAGYLELQSEFAKRMFLVANIRDDVSDQFGEHATFRIAPAVILPLTETKLRASYGTGFKAPTLSQLFQDFPAFHFFANPNLKPEQSAGYDVGFEQPLFNDRVRFGSTYFRNDITNLINFNNAFTTNINVGQATTEGTENFVSADITDRFGIRADYTFTRAVDDATLQQLERRPIHKWSTTATWKLIDPLTVSATVLTVSSFTDVNRDGTNAGLTAPGYTIVNLAGDYLVNDQIKVFGRVDNLFNLHYQNPTGFLQPGFGIFGGLRMASFGVK
jgi:vitamin B12 transporter